MKCGRLTRLQAFQVLWGCRVLLHCASPSPPSRPHHASPWLPGHCPVGLPSSQGRGGLSLGGSILTGSIGRTPLYICSTPLNTPPSAPVSRSLDPFFCFFFPVGGDHLEFPPCLRSGQPLSFSRADADFPLTNTIDTITRPELRFFIVSFVRLEPRANPRTADCLVFARWSMG